MTPQYSNLPKFIPDNALLQRNHTGLPENLIRMKKWGVENEFMSSSPVFQNILELRPFIKVICITAGCANGRWNPNVPSAILLSPTCTHCSKRHSPATKRPKSVVYCDWVLIWHKFICYCWERSVQLITLVSPLKYKPHRSSLTLSARISLLCSSPLLLFLSLSGLYTVSLELSAPSLTK